MIFDRRTTRRAFLAAVPATVLAACTAARPRRASPRSGGQAATTTTAAAPTTTTAPAAAALPPFVRSGPADRPAVALTFHGSGDPALLDALLAVAHDHRAPLTIFAVGQWLDANPPVAARIADAGHELANHTYTHPVLSRLPADQIASEITRCRDALAHHSSSPARWFRPSGVETPGATILDAAAAAGYQTVVGYDVDPHDYQDPGASAVRARVAAGVGPGAIVSLHTGHQGTVDALAGILTDLQAKGLQPVTVTDLLRP